MAFPRQRPRTCVACREESPKGVLIRIVRSPAGEVFWDERGGGGGGKKLPGRGAYLCARRECLDKARKTRALARALKTEVPDALYARLGEYIDAYWDSYREKFSAAEARPKEPRLTTELRSKELRSLLGLSRRAGLAHIGMDSVKSQCAKFKENKGHTKHTKRTKNAKTEKSLLILTASDCSEPVRDFARRQAEENRIQESEAPEGGTRWLGVPLSTEEFSAALGANNVQMIALPVRSGLTDRIRALLGEQGVSGGPARPAELECLQKFENGERPGDIKETKNGRLISLPEGGVALEQNESV